jgi:hypothetical protein
MLGLVRVDRRLLLLLLGSGTTTSSTFISNDKTVNGLPWSKGGSLLAILTVSVLVLASYMTTLP